MFSRAFAAIGIAALAAISPATALGGDLRSCAVEGIEGGGARYWHGGAWSDLQVSDILPAEAKVSTGPSTRVRILCDDQIAVVIGTGTEVNLEQLVGAAGPDTSVVMQLVHGILGIVAPQRTWRRFDIRTPVAIASVRSTEWLVEHDATDGTAVFVRAGGVAIKTGDNRRFALSRGEGLSISAAGDPGQVKTWGAKRIAKSTGALGFDWR